LRIHIASINQRGKPDPAPARGMAYSDLIQQA
jgi:hypothetical protein